MTTKEATIAGVILGVTAGFVLTLHTLYVTHRDAKTFASDGTAALWEAISSSSTTQLNFFMAHGGIVYTAKGSSSNGVYEIRLSPIWTNKSGHQ